MTDTANATSPPSSTIPADDPDRKLTVADPDGAGVRHVFVAGGTYTVLVSGAETAGRYCLLDMLVPNGGGPPWLCRRQDSTTASCTKSCASASQAACCRAKSKSAGACLASHCSQSDSPGHSYFEPLFTRIHLIKRH